MIGGDKPSSIDYTMINRFDDPKMAEYMNPIYGAILTKNGKISNRYYLAKNNSKRTDNFSKLILKCCNKEQGSTTVRPTNDILLGSNMPYLIGCYIALKFIGPDKLVFRSPKGKFIPANNKPVYKEFARLESAVSKLGKYIPLNENTIDVFHLLLYCLWWVANDNDGIDEYYKGIQKVFDIANEHIKDSNLYIGNRHVTEKSFEYTAIGLIKERFKLYTQQYSKHFCIDKPNASYPDCGETTARNLINILCFNGNTCNPEHLREKGAIPGLLEYYMTFKNFELQSSMDTQNIYGTQLNARDAWSKLLTDSVVQNNVNFINTCSTYGYELNAGDSLDKENKKNNLLQLIHNLLPLINTWDDLKNKNIINVNTRDFQGNLGQIILTTISDNKFTIEFMNSHYHIVLPPEVKETNLSHLTSDEKRFINTILQEDIVIDNYLDMDLSNEKLQELIEDQYENLDDNEYDKEYYIGLFELSLTDKYDSDLRKRIKIGDSQPMFDHILNTYGSNSNMYDYTYYAYNFEFVARIPGMNKLNCILYMSSSNIDFRPLGNIEIIGDYFCNNMVNIPIDLTPLANVKSIGNNFLDNCHNVKVIFPEIWPNLVNIESGFMSRVMHRQPIITINAPNLQNIGNMFMKDSNIKNLDLSNLINLSSIGDEFMYGSNIENISFPETIYITKIANHFMSRSDIHNLVLPKMPNATTIKAHFLYNCKKLKTVKMSPSAESNITTIGVNAFSNCAELIEIDFTNLSNVSSIKPGFLNACKKIENIDLTPMTKLLILDNVMMGCTNLKQVYCNSQLKFENSFSNGPYPKINGGKGKKRKTKKRSGTKGSLKQRKTRRL